MTGRNIKLGGIGICVILAAFVISSMRGARDEKAVEKEIVVDARLITVGAVSVDAVSEVDGVVQAGMSAILSPKIRSTVVAVMVWEGDTIRAGQPLVRLEAKDLAASVQQAKAAFGASTSSAESARTAALLEDKATRADVVTAQATVQQEKESLAIVRDGARRQEKARADLAVQQAKAQFDLSMVELKRTRTLFDQGAVSKQLVDLAETQERLTRTAWDSARQQSDLVVEGSRKEEIRSAEERVRQAESMLDGAKARRLSAQVRSQQATAAGMQTKQAGASLLAAQTMAGYSVVRAPFNGVVVRRFVDPGDQVGPGSLTIMVEDRSGWRLEADVPEAMASAVQMNSVVRAQIDALGSRTVRGRIIEMRPSGDPATHTIRVKAALEPDPKLKAGQFGRLLLPQTLSSPKIEIPSTAIIEGDGLARVWTLGKDDRAQLTIITTGKIKDGMTTVLSGLSSGARIVVSNLDNLDNGAQVRAVL